MLKCISYARDQIYFGGYLWVLFDFLTQHQTCISFIFFQLEKPKF